MEEDSEVVKIYWTKILTVIKCLVQKVDNIFWQMRYFSRHMESVKKGNMEGLEMKNITLEINNLRRLNNKGNYQ